MAVPNVDAVFSFQHLVDNLPQWRTTVTELSTYSSQKHTEFVAEYSRLLHQAKPKKQKSPSMCSVRSSDERSARLPDGPHEGLATPNPSDYVEISPLEAGNRFLYAQAHRKRKPGTSMRSGASGPTRFRNKQMAVIYYDAHIQSELDKLVKGIGAARNYLRKGKNAYAASQGFQLPSISRRFEHLLPGAGRDIYKSARTPPRLPQTKSDTTMETTMNPPIGEAAFARADKELETIQAVCETAAHQAIRDGDCKLELDNTLKNIDSLFGLAKTSLEGFIAEDKKKKEEEEARLKRETEAATASEVSSNSTPSTLCDDDESIEAFNITSKGLPSLTEALEGLKRPPIHSISSAPASAPMLDAIEVDDDDDDQSSIDLDISKFRMTNTRRVRA